MRLVVGFRFDLLHFRQKLTKTKWHKNCIIALRRPISLPSDYLLRLMLIGDKHVGKTSLVERFCSDQFSDTPVEEDLDFKQADVLIDDKRVRLQLVSVLSRFRFVFFSFRCFSSHFVSSGSTIITKRNYVSTALCISRTFRFLTYVQV
jgi:GTPase SAR1 family protein